ncbi:hypothetical protein IQ273_18225 [Nodosilinea sp. LEGE 07298]|uniref:hypothetical protein n=1 Tax=Nodosilinea sp. LEGE 07298 TaxID=2777970 RepID=UPI00187EF956|nr:hypothetical protein [Nodosilinea sp. LEGE 07298]MBE9111346.1 hypothetical protein [Nodosilinea sp. LEGE 07298]
MRNARLHLYDDEGQLFIHPEYVAKGLMVPSYVDFHYQNWSGIGGLLTRATTPFQTRLIGQ